MPPRVTWLLPVRNAEQHLESTLISIAEQDYPEHAHTVYVWDDGSTDGTADLLRKWIGREVQGRIIGTERIGLGRALAQLTASAQTELLARIDADDTAESERLTKQVEYMVEHRRVGLLNTAMRVIDDPKRLITQPEDDASLRWALRFKNPVNHPSVMLRRSAVLEVGNYRALDAGKEDYDLWARLGLIVRFANLSTPLTNYRIHEASATAGWKASNGEQFYRRRNALIDRLLPGVAPSDGVRLLDLIRRPDDLNVTADDLVRFRHAAMLAAKACRFPPDYFTSTALFKEQYNNLKTRKLKSQPLIRPLWPLLKRANRMLHPTKTNASSSSQSAA